MRGAEPRGDRGGGEQVSQVRGAIEEVVNRFLKLEVLYQEVNEEVVNRYLK